MKHRGMNQVELEQASGVSQPAISNLLNGVSLDGVTAVVVARLSLGLKVPPGFLLLGEGDVIPDLSLSEGDDVVKLDEKKDPLVPASSGSSRSDQQRRSRRR